MDEILVIIGRLELKKQIKALGDRQRVELAELLYKLNESKERIGRRADSVVLLETYGTIAFQYWVQDEVALRSEIDQELYRLKCLDEDRHLSFRLAVEAAIDRRLNELRVSNTVEETERYIGEMELIELEAAAQKLRLERKALLKLQHARIANKVKDCRVWLKSLSLEQRKKLLLKAVRRQYLTMYTAIEEEYIEYYADILMPLYKESLVDKKAKK